MAEFAIEAVGLSKRYAGLFGGGHQALRGIDLAVERGSAFGLIGPNGAGKTTFIKLLLGVVSPTGGSVRVLGGDPQEPGVRARIGYMPERLYLPSAWKPVAYLQSVGRMKGMAISEQEGRASLERVGIGAAVDRRIGGYSKGMKQRLALAAAMLGAPDFLVLDEPTDGIDPLGRIEVRTLLLEERQRGATLFLNSHLLAETERICDRIGILAGGRIAACGSLEELRRASLGWKATFAPGFAEEALAGLGFRALGEPGRFAIAAADAQELDVKLQAARQAGALLTSLEQERRELEQVLADAMSESREAA